MRTSPLVFELSSSPDVYLLLAVKRKVLDEQKEPFLLQDNITGVNV